MTNKDLWEMGNHKLGAVARPRRRKWNRLRDKGRPKKRRDPEKEMRTAGFKYSWRKMEAVAQTDEDK